MGGVVTACSIVAFAVCLEAVPVQVGGDPAPAAKATIAGHLQLDGVPKFGEVTPTLYRGGQPSREGFRHLAEFGINIVVDNGRSDKNERLSEQLGMRYVSIPWLCPFPKDEVFARFLKVVEDNPGKKIFVHCRFGDARTGMMIAAYRMKVQGWTAEEALREMSSYGFHGMRRLVCPGLTRYEENFPDHLRKDPIFQNVH